MGGRSGPGIAAASSGGPRRCGILTAAELAAEIAAAGLGHARPADSAGHPGSAGRGVPIYVAAHTPQLRPAALLAALRLEAPSLVPKEDLLPASELAGLRAEEAAAVDLGVVLQASGSGVGCSKASLSYPAPCCCRRAPSWATRRPRSLRWPSCSGGPRGGCTRAGTTAAACRSRRCCPLCLCHGPSLRTGLWGPLRSARCRCPCGAASPRGAS